MNVKDIVENLQINTGSVRCEELPMSACPTEIRNSYGSLLFITCYQDNHWLVEAKRKNKLTRVRLFTDGDMSIENFNIKDSTLELEYL